MNGKSEYVVDAARINPAINALEKNQKVLLKEKQKKDAILNARKRQEIIDKKYIKKMIKINAQRAYKPLLKEIMVTINTAYEKKKEKKEKKTTYTTDNDTLFKKPCMAKQVRYGGVFDDGGVPFLRELLNECAKKLHKQKFMITQTEKILSINAFGHSNIAMILTIYWDEQLYKEESENT